MEMTEKRCEKTNEEVFQYVQVRDDRWLVPGWWQRGRQ